MSLVSLTSSDLEVTVNPDVGGTIIQVRHRGLGLSVLGTVPWNTIDAPIASLAARDEPEWLTRYTGGWPLLFPNGGDACTVDGVFHGFHGEASIAPWEVEQHGETLRLSRRFKTVAARMERDISLSGETLIMRERLTYDGDGPVDVMWGHHPTFGSDLLSGEFEITTGARRATVEATYDPPANPLKAGQQGEWPHVPGKAGPVDMRRPAAPWASLVYLDRFDGYWAAIRRLDNAVAAILSWDGDRFPFAWLWYELEANTDEPWNGRTRLIGIEPNTTPSGLGLADALRRGLPVLRLSPRSEYESELRLHVFKPQGPILQLPAGLGISNSIIPQQ